MTAANITVSDLEIMSAAEHYRTWMCSRVRDIGAMNALCAKGDGNGK